MQAVDGEVNDVVIAPVDEPVGGGAIEEVVFAGSLPDKMPRILRIAGEDTTAMRFDGLELAGGGLGEATLLVGDRVLVAAGGGRHETDAENAAIGGIAKAFDTPTVGAVGSFECAGERGVSEAVAGRGRVDVRGDLDEVVAINLGRGLGKGDTGRVCPERGCRERGKNHQDRAQGSWHGSSFLKFFQDGGQAVIAHRHHAISWQNCLRLCSLPMHR